MNTTVCQITRGMAAAISIADAVRRTATRSGKYELISGRPGAEAKNRAVELALGYGENLLLIEDDVLAEPALWDAAFNLDPAAVAFAPAPCRSGEWNTVRNTKTGEVLFSGSVFLVIGLDVLRRMIEIAPLFEAYFFTNCGSSLTRRDPHPLGRASDVNFWWRLDQLSPKPRVIELPPVIHLSTPLNSGAVTLQDPIRIVPFEVKE